MAKGNLFLGLGRGSVGDVTLYRKNGEQISRVRVRKVSNPSSQGQLLQRAVTATVAQAYAAGRAIFDHSFQGRKVGSANQNIFMARNMSLLRARIVSELDALTPAAEGAVAVVQRGAVYPVANAYRVSEGTLSQDLFTVAPSSEPAKLAATLPAAGSAATLADYCAANSIQADDIYTIVAFGVRQNSGWSASAPERFRTHYSTGFGFIRLMVKPSALVSTVAMSSATYGDLFEMNYEGATPLPESTLLPAAINIDQVVYSAATGSLGVIKSRDNSGERSTCELTLPASMDWGIKSEFILERWDPSVQAAGQSELILEGGGF